MTKAAKATKVKVALDVHGRLPAKVTLDQEVSVDDVTKLGQLVFGQVSHAALVRYTCLVADALGAGPANAVDIGQCDFHPLFGGNVYTRNTCHCLAPFRKRAFP